MVWRRVQAQGAEEVPGVTSLQPLAVGGNSTVYRAWQKELDRWVAVKVLGVTLSEARARERFVRECSAVGRLTGHPNIVTVLAAGVTRSDRPFLTMDLFERGSLGDFVATSGPVPVDLALRYGVKLAGALETAHRSGILHRDLKPENVLLSRFGEPGLADFGIASLGEARGGGTEAFTASHAAPEVLDGRPATVAADVYGLGSTLWTAVAGRLPFGDGSEGPLKLMLRVLQEPLPPLGRADVPGSVEEALQWAMAKDPAERPSSAQAFGEHLCSIQAALGMPVSQLVLPDELEHRGAPEAPSAPRQPDPVEPPPPPAARPAATTIRPPPRRAGTPSGDRQVPTGSEPTSRRRSAAEAADPVQAAQAAQHAPATPPAGSPGGGLSDPGPLAPPAPRELEPTFVRPRAEAPAPPGNEIPAPSRPAVVVAIVGAAVVLALSLVAAAVIATRDDGGTSTASTVPATVARPAPPVSVTTTVALPTARAPAKVAVSLADPLRAVVSWEPPADRVGLLGYVVAHRLRLGGGEVTSQGVSGPDAAQASVSLPAPGSRCFVVQSVYATGQGTASEPACT